MAKGGPKFVQCYLCCQQFGVASLPIHQQSCYKKRLQEWELLPKSNRGPPPTHPSLVPIPDPSAPVGKQQQQTPVTGGLIPCRLCARKFSSDRIARHEAACEKVHMKRGQFNAQAKRLSAIAEGSTEPVHPQPTVPHRRTSSRKSWKKDHQSFLTFLRQAKDQENKFSANIEIKISEPPRNEVPFTAERPRTEAAFTAERRLASAVPPTQAPQRSLPSTAALRSRTEVVQLPSKAEHTQTYYHSQPQGKPVVCSFEVCKPPVPAPVTGGFPGSKKEELLPERVPLLSHPVNPAQSEAAPLRTIRGDQLTPRPGGERTGKAYGSVTSAARSSQAEVKVTGKTASRESLIEVPTPVAPRNSAEAAGARLSNRAREPEMSSHWQAASKKGSSARSVSSFDVPGSTGCGNREGTKARRRSTVTAQGCPVGQREPRCSRNNAFRDRAPSPAASDEDEGLKDPYYAKLYAEFLVTRAKRAAESRSRSSRTGYHVERSYDR
eukprot:RCo002549